MQRSRYSYRHQNVHETQAESLHRLYYLGFPPYLLIAIFLEKIKVNSNKICQWQAIFSTLRGQRAKARSRGCQLSSPLLLA